ncbi:histidine kinase [Streptomyces sp. NPDC048172]|uniref:sensor histidine kinase n=1 Tax=Streptomyces sp. NPDC048172 TaxID=3365505 RepID=UPI00370FFB4C
MNLFSGFLSRGLRELRRSLTLWLLSLRASWYALLTMLCSSGPALLLLPVVHRCLRGLTARQRELATEWSGVRLPSPTTPLPPRGAPLRDRFQAIFGERYARREWLWLLVEPLAGNALVSLPLAMVLCGVWGLGMAFYGGVLANRLDGLWYLFIPVTGPVSSLLAALLGAALLPAALAVAGPVVRVHGRLVAALLTPNETAVMAERIEHLSATRSHAVDTQMSELRRIERDLHDGAQARLVAMGMTLDAADELLERDPEAGRALLAEVRKSSAQALEELRDLVRGIHPPVLADRGLGDAVRALALVSPLRTEVSLDLPGRPDMPVESAVYFAVSEALTNAAKHSDADRVWIDIAHDYARGVLRVSVTDDGRGGADVSRGTGLRGIERRLATFDGVLAVNSPPGGPTMVMMELPCVLSSPKTISC